MENENLIIITRLLLSVVAGALIGLERTYHGRPAGFRTHTLVCVASALLMLLVAYHIQLLPGVAIEAVRIDPSRMAQGIMTGIGFLGAGVIMKEQLTIRGLTTAASVWITAAVGIAIGAGFYFAAFITALIAIGTLSVFRWIENVFPSLHYAGLSVCYGHADPRVEAALAEMLKRHHIDGVKPSYHLSDEGKRFRYHMTIRSRSADNFRQLASALSQMEDILEFSITPTGD
ncbi:MAG: MgtC/SapB family protein [Gammaproteobacteria bacterium]|nr:MgtC/SapB family protein [Gammaproteobacteria bacterium]